MRLSVKILWITVLGGIGIFVLLLLLINFRVIGNMISIETLENPESVLASEIIGEDGAVVGKYYQRDRSYTNYEAIPKHVINGLIATECPDFYDNNGIITRDIWHIPFVQQWMGKRHGSRSLTQQLASRLLANNSDVSKPFNDAKSNFQNMQTWLLTVKLERHFTKQEIIALYLSNCLFGDQVKGIENAAHIFFNKKPGDLSLEESAVLIGMLRGGYLYNPCRSLEMAKRRRDVVIYMMQKYNYVSPATAIEASSKPIILRYRNIDDDGGIVPYFRNTLREALESWCREHKKAEGSAYDLYRDGLRIYTKINPKMQSYVERVVSHERQQLQQRLADQFNIKSDSVWNKWPQFPEIFTKELRRYREETESIYKTSLSADSNARPVYIIRITDRYGNIL